MSERRVAVIGVHGVGEQVAGDTAAKIAEMLGQVGGGQYSEFTETALKIPVTADGLGIAPKPATQVAPVVAKPLPKRESPLKSFGSVFYADNKNNNRTDLPDLEFTKSLLKEGEDYRAVYETTYWRGKKHAAPIDIYELYWSDLSHGGSSGSFAVFGQFVQLLVHLSSLGRTAAAAATRYIENNLSGQSPSWIKFYFLNALSYWLLSMPIVIGNLWFILLGLDFTAAKLAAEAKPVDVSVAQGVICGLWLTLALGWLFFKILPRWPIPLCALATAALGALGGWGGWYLGAVWEVTVIGLLAAPVVWGIGEILMRVYDNMRPGALALWRRVGAAVLVVAFMFTLAATRDATYRALLVIPQSLVKVPASFNAFPDWNRTYQGLLAVAQAGAPPSSVGITLDDAAKLFQSYLATSVDGILLSAIFHTGEVLFLCLTLVWIVLCACNLALVLLGAMLANGQVARTVHTCVATALLPAPLFLGAALAVWGLFAQYLSGWLSSVYIAPLVWPLHWPAPGANISWSGPLQHVAGATNLLSVHDLLVHYIVKSGWLLFLPYSEMVLLVLMLIFVAMAPSICLEIAPLGSAGAARNKNTSKSLGSWLNSGFNSIRIGSSMVLCAFLFVLGAGLGAGLGYVLNWAFGWSLPPSPLANFRSQFPALGDTLKAVGLGAGTATAGFLAATKLFSGALSDVFGKMRVAVDTLQDVDNWLRERPVGGTVRLHVFARYHSLLRYLAGKGYTEVLIVAHSQGTVVTADFLRHLKLGGGEFPEGASKWQIRLLTMGCPLRQLYNWRFPQLYDWVVPDGVASGPKPGELGVTKWVNAYGSGDYVGRHLWGSELPPCVPAAEPSVICGNPATWQFCVGAQAHTFYLNPANATIAATIDGLI